DCPLRDECVGPLRGIDRNRYSPRPVGGGTPGRHSFARFYGGGERRAVPGTIVAAHRLQAERVDALAGEREAHQAAPMRGHEVYRIGSGQIGRAAWREGGVSVVGREYYRGMRS